SCALNGLHRFRFLVRLHEVAGETDHDFVEEADSRAAPECIHDRVIDTYLLQNWLRGYGAPDELARLLHAQVTTGGFVLAGDPPHLRLGRAVVAASAQAFRHAVDV